MAEDGTTKNYSLALEVEETPSDEKLLFETPSAHSCEESLMIDSGELRIVNNMWNTGSLALGTYTQCIYKYEGCDSLLMGWEWQYPTDNPGAVYALPELSYGWQPWHENSTTQKLPRKISDIDRLKVSDEEQRNLQSGL